MNPSATLSLPGTAAAPAVAPPGPVPGHAKAAPRLLAPEGLFAEERSRPWQYVPALLLVLAAHLAAGWALMQIDAVRAAVLEAAPMMVDLITPPPPPAAAPPPPPPRQLKLPPPPPPLIVAAPSPAPAVVAFEAPPPPPEPPPVAVQAPAAPAPPAPPVITRAAEPKTVSASAVGYLAQPPLTYPSFSRRARETGTTTLRVLIDERGLPRQVLVDKSSGSGRLDDAAITAMKQARFKPYTENGTALMVWVMAPIEFVLEN